MIMRENHAADFFSIQNETVRDDRLSLAARGLLVYMLSMSDDWAFSVAQLAKALKLSRPTIIALIKELESAGYINIKRQQNKRGQFSGSAWAVYEVPNHSQENRSTENLTTANTAVKKTEVRQNRTTEFLTPKKYQYKEIPNNKKDQLIEEKYKRSPAGIKNNVFLSAEERQELNRILGAYNAGRYIDLLSFYLNDHPETKYKSHFEAILKWFERDNKAKGA